MTGLEKIISQIEHESNERCLEIKNKAQAEAQKIIDEANADAQVLVENEKAETAKRVENINQSAVSTAELTKSRTVLAAKLRIIDETLNRSLDFIKSVPNKEYFEILKDLISKNVRPGEGELHLSKSDTEKLPSNFVDSINNSLRKAYKIKLGKPAEIDSGFVLSYGDIDINCSFDAIAAEKRDELRDTLNSLLFN